MKNLFLCSVFVLDILEVDDDDGGATYMSVFEYTDQSNNVIRAEEHHYSYSADEIGDIVEIVYTPKSETVRASSFVDSFGNLYSNTILVSLMGCLFFIVGIKGLNGQFLETGDLGID